jgi:hypothetical protein
MQRKIQSETGNFLVRIGQIFVGNELEARYVNGGV